VHSLFLSVHRGPAAIHLQVQGVSQLEGSRLCGISKTNGQLILPEDAIKIHFPSFIMQ
jgi:hypothetical protein